MKNIIMKNILLTISVLFLSTKLFCQSTEFKFTKNGFTDFVVTPIEGKSQQEIFTQTLNWLKVTYKNPKEVLKAQIDSEYVRIEGFQTNGICLKSMGMLICYDVRYQIEIHFKDGKYKFDAISLETYTPPSQYTRGGWSNFEINSNDYSMFYKEDGQIKNVFKYYPSNIESIFNGLNKSLETYLKSEKSPTNKSDW